MSAAARPSDLLVRDLAHRSAPLTELLPAGWYRIDVPGVGRPVVIGPGGVFVLELRHASTLGLGLAGDATPPRPWDHDHRHQLSTPRVAAELASQLLTWACGVPVRCDAVVVVLADRDGEGDDPRLDRPDRPDGERLPGRPDGVEVVSAARLIRWLQRLPQELDADTIDIVLEHVDAGGDLIAL